MTARRTRRRLLAITPKIWWRRLSPGKKRTGRQIESRGAAAPGEDRRWGRSLRAADEVTQDLRYALRTFTKSPAFTAVAVLTLALGIGAVTVIYSIVHNVAIAPLPYRDSDRLVNVRVHDTQTGRARGTFSLSEFVDLRDRSSVFEDVVGTLGQGMRYETRDSVEYLRAVWVTPNFFSFMGLEPLLGRAILPADGRPDAPAVAVLRHRAWMAYFGGDPGVVGATIVLGGQPRTIVGVMPPRFTWHAADVWIPGPVDRAGAHGEPAFRNFQARLRKGVSMREAEAQLDVLAAARAREHPKEYPDRFRVQVVNVIEYTVGPFRAVLFTTLAFVSLLLLIACCNVANMLLARATTREREMMIRVALGAGRGRIVRQLMVESMLLAVAGAALGCLLAYFGIEALVSRLPQSPLPGEVDITLNAPVLLFALGAAGISAVAFGMTPALVTARRNVAGGLKSGGKGIAGGRGAVRSALVAAEIALSLVLVLGAALLARSFMSLASVDLGFNPDNLVSVPVAFPPGRYATAAEKHRYYQEALGRLAALPGISAAAVTTAIPPFQAGASSILEIPGMPTRSELRVDVQLCTADYFRTFGIQFTRGDRFPESRADERPSVAIVNQTFVNQYFGGRDPVGTQIRLAPATGSADPARQGAFEIVGTVQDVRNSGLQDAPEAQVYLPWMGATGLFSRIVVRTVGEPVNSLHAIRRELTQIDRQVAVIQTSTLREALDRSFYAQPRFSLLVLGIFAGTGILLVAVGVFSVMAYTVSRQKKEIAVRMALGAPRTHVFGVVLRSGAQLLAAGSAVGLAASFATNRLLASQLWNVSPHDPLAAAAAMSLIAFVALAACYIPARRAVDVDPIAALRED